MQIGCTDRINICNMNKIGFKNFRRFQNFDPIDFKGVSFLVGRNNAGKSTVVKALLLIENYFKARRIEHITFGNKILDDANIVTYGRALNNTAKIEEDNYISFEFQIENYKVEIIITGNEEDAAAIVIYLDVIDIDHGLAFKFDLPGHTLTLAKLTGTDHLTLNLKVTSDLDTQIEKIKNDLHVFKLKKTSKEFIQLNSELENLLNKREIIEKQYSEISSTPKQRFELTCDYGEINSLVGIVDDVILQLMANYNIDFDKVQNGDDPSEKFVDLRALKELDPIFVASSFIHFMNLMNDFSIAYMGANPAKQSALFAIRDKNNALAQAIHEFKQLNILNGEEEHRFVSKWMNEFEVGTDFAIEMLAGEAYQMKILSNETWVHLADKGMGSIQAMLLIMRIACVIRKIKLAGNASTKTRLIDKITLIIEEPELNLHPALQSKLADLFLDVHQKYKIVFLIETHSEYILRRSQVLVAENEFEVAPNENPFCVYYFPKDAEQQPYGLEYESNGRFKRNFEEGFFDEATKSTMKLLKIQKTI